MWDPCFYLYFMLHVLMLSSFCEADIKLCANPDCTEPISKARSVILYSADSSNRLSFKKGQEMKILSKFQDQKDYWVAIIDDRKGYVPSQLVRETKIFYPTEKLIKISDEDEINSIDNTNVQKHKNSSKFSLGLNSISTPTAVNEDLKGNEDTNLAPKIQPQVFQKSLTDSVPTQQTFDKSTNEVLFPTKSYDVIEGTTVFSDEVDEFKPTTSQSSAPIVGTLDYTSEIPSNVGGIKKPVAERASNIIINIDDKVFSDDDKINSRIENSQASNMYSNKMYKKNGYEENVAVQNNDSDHNEVDVDNDGDKDDNDDDGDDDDDDDNNDDGNVEDVDLEELKNNSSIQSAKTSKDFDDIHENQKPEVLDVNIIDSEKKPSVDSVEKTASESLTLSSFERESNLGTQKNFDGPENKIFSNFDEGTGNIKYESIENGLQSLDKNNDHKTLDILENTKNSITGTSSNIYSKEDSGVFSKTDVNKTEQYKHDFSINNMSDASKLSAEDSLITNTPAIVTDSLPINNDNKVSIYDNRNHQELSSENLPHLPRNKADPSKTISSNFISSEAESINNQIEPKVEIDIESSDLLNEVIVNSKGEETEHLVEKSESAAALSNENNIETPSINVSNSNIALKFVKENSDKTPDLQVEGVDNTEEIEKKIQVVEEITHQVTPDSDNIYNQILNTITGWLGYTDPKEESDFQGQVFHKAEESEDLKANTNSFNDVTSLGNQENHRSNLNEHDPTKEKSSFWDIGHLESIPTTGNTLLYLIITAITVLLFTLGHNFIERKGKTGPLIAKINKLEQELLVTSRECLLLKDETQHAKDKISLYENSTNNDLIITLKQELEEYKKAKAELESSVEILQQELDAATEAGLDLNKMLSEFLTQKGGSESLLESVEKLQTQLNSQQKLIDEMTKKLGIKNEENSMLQTSLDTANEKNEVLEEQLNEIKYNLNIHLKEKEDFTQDLKSQINSLQSRINQLSESKEKEILIAKGSLQKVQKDYDGVSEALALKEEECKSLKDSVKQLKIKGNVDFNSLFDVCKIKAELSKLKTDNSHLLVKLKEEENTRNSAEINVQNLQVEFDELQKQCNDFKQKEEEAQKKLEVLSTYFKEKETQLQKELGLQEVMWSQKKGDERAVYDMVKSLQEEVESYRCQNETLKKEILEQERSLKNQMASVEQKAHENWIAARQAERKLEENKQENAQLRNRLTLIFEKNLNNDLEGKSDLRTEELNGVEPTSPVHHDASSPLLFPPVPLDHNSSAILPPAFLPHPMFMPPPIGGFIPPPPFLPGDRRPPPLGRMSSPPLNSRFSPPPPDYQFERMSTPPLSPHNRSYRSPNDSERSKEHFRHRTPPQHSLMHSRNWDENHEVPGFIPISNHSRESRRVLKNSNVSSGHSSSDSLDQSTRQSGRV